MENVVVYMRVGNKEQLKSAEQQQRETMEKMARELNTPVHPQVMKAPNALEAIEHKSKNVV